MDNLAATTPTRCNLRNAINQPVCLELVGPKHGKIRSINIYGTCVDISSEGMGITTNSDALCEGDVLKLHLSINDMKVTLPILSAVKWLRQVDDHYKAGLQFLA